MRILGGRFRIKDRAPGRSVLSLFWWDLASFVCELYMRLFHRIRVVRFSRTPASGPVIFVSNHQSYFDPVINNVQTSQRPYTGIAGAHLTKFKPFGLLLKSWGTVFVSAAAGDKGALKIALNELQNGRAVLIYPEGSRSPDGLVQPFEKGLLLLIRRSRAPVLPIGIEGAFDVWPKDRTFPRLSGGIASASGELIPSEELLALEPAELLERLRGEVDTLRLEARRILRERSGGRWPPPGPADEPSPAT
ncbi:MAG: lysophospholipid acyltransferase family protein [Planctomycetota bacterium]|nr:lysophospholipid acyltransferase family protein [Planctomycetota bacterium]